MTSRGQFDRSNVTGARPASLQPGTPAFNWRDKVIWVGDASGNAMRFSRKVESYNQALAYAPDDFAIVGADLWRAIATIPAGAPFNQSQWQRLSDVGRNEISQPYASEIYSGGAVARLTNTTVSVTAGQGIVVNNTTPGQILSTPVTWSTFIATLSPLATPWTIVGLNGVGAVVHISTDQFDAQWRRENICLALVLWASGAIFAVRDASIRAGGDAETLRDEYFVNGGSYRASGGRIASVTGTMALRNSVGTVFALGTRWRADPTDPNIISIPAASVFPITSVSATSVVGVPSPQVQTISYDPDGLGVVTPVPAGDFTIQYLFATPDMQSFFLQLGQTAYGSQFEAVSAITDDYADFKSFAPGVALMMVAAIIAEENGGVIDPTLDGAVILNAAPFGDPFAGAGTASAAGADYYLRDGSRPLTGDMDAAGFEIVDAVLDGGTF